MGAALFASRAVVVWGSGCCSAGALVLLRATYNLASKFFSKGGGVLLAGGVLVFWSPRDLLALCRSACEGVGAGVAGLFCRSAARSHPAPRCCSASGGVAAFFCCAVLRSDRPARGGLVLIFCPILLGGGHSATLREQTRSLIGI